MMRRTDEAARPLLRGPPVLAAPLHPIFVHFTIALTAASFALDLVGRVLQILERSPGERVASDAAFWALGAAVIVTIGTLVTGVLSRMRVPVGNGPAHSYLRVHMALGPIFFGLLLVAFAWRSVLYSDGSVAPWSYLVLMGTVCGIMTVQGYLGGELVYRFGMAVEGQYRTLPVEHPGSRPCPPSESTAAIESARA